MLMLRDVLKNNKYPKIKNLENYSYIKFNQSNIMYELLFQYSSDPVYIVDIEGSIITYNDAASAFFGHYYNELDEILSKLKPRNYNESFNFFKLAIEGELQEYQATYLRKNGNTINTEIKIVPIIVNHIVNGVIVFIKDLSVSMIGNTTVKENTYQLQLEEKFSINEEQSKTIFDSLNVSIFSKDLLTNSVLFCSSGIESLSGYTSKEFEDNQISWKKCIYFEDLEEYNDRNQYLGLGLISKAQYRIIHKCGEIKWIEDTTIPIFNDKGIVVQTDSILTDITEQKRIDEKMAYLAYHDFLTNLPNRKKFEDELDAQIRQSNITNKHFAIIYSNMDGFKRVNDTLGHLIGDNLLKQISDRMKECISKHDLLARMGGDEFAFLIRDLNEVEQSVTVAKRIIDSLDEPFIVDDYELFVTASLGITIYPNDGADVKTLLKKADTALHRAKAMGKNNFQVYTSSMSIESFKQYQLERDLRKAIKNNELFIYYQPKVDSKTLKIVSAEALLRWEHPEWGMVSPREFIPLAEENDLIFKISDWVFRKVCEQIKEWEQQDLPVVPISINISPKRFLRNDWLDATLQMIKETKVDPRLLEFEITESCLIENEESFFDSISALKNLGAKIILDDFGKGYSSLSFLNKFNVDTIKIDRSFTKDLVENDTITKSIIYLAHGLKLNVVAEGVETKEQLKILKQLECDMIQGYLFSKPIPNKEFAKLVSKSTLEPSKDQLGKGNPNRRKLFRVNFKYPLAADMTIAQIKGKALKLGKTEVLIENIGLGGLCFLSHIKLPVNSGILLEFETQIFDQIVTLQGQVVWKEELGAEFSQYGVEFKMTDQSMVTLLVNKLAIQIEKNPLPSDCRFVKEKSIEYLKRISK